MDNYIKSVTDYVIKTNFASGRKQATHNAVEKLFKVVAYD